MSARNRSAVSLDMMTHSRWWDPTGYIATWAATQHIVDRKLVMTTWIMNHDGTGKALAEDVQAVRYRRTRLASEGRYGVEGKLPDGTVFTPFIGNLEECRVYIAGIGSPAPVPESIGYVVLMQGTPHLPEDMREIHPVIEDALVNANGWDNWYDCKIYQCTYTLGIALSSGNPYTKYTITEEVPTHIVDGEISLGEATVDTEVGYVACWNDNSHRAKARIYPTPEAAVAVGNSNQCIGIRKCTYNPSEVTSNSAYVWGYYDVGDPVPTHVVDGRVVLGKIPRTGYIVAAIPEATLQRIYITIDSAMNWLEQYGTPGWNVYKCTYDPDGSVPHSTYVWTRPNAWDPIPTYMVNGKIEPARGYRIRRYL